MDHNYLPESKSVLAQAFLARVGGLIFFDWTCC